MANSKMQANVHIIHGSSDIIIAKVFADDTANHEKYINVWNSVCPDNMFANNRIERLKILAKYDKNSINTRNRLNPSGKPCGINKLKNWILLVEKPIKLKLMKKLNDTKKTEMKELVIV